MKTIACSILFLILTGIAQATSDDVILTVDKFSVVDGKTCLAKVHSYLGAKRYDLAIGCNLRFPDCLTLVAGDKYAFKIMPDGDPDAYAESESIKHSIRINGIDPDDHSTSLSAVYFVVSVD